ncbi:MAG: ATP cone domain-containing protein [bacterium]|nr:ATP cone domain-containing protein [bacterium]
MITTVVKRNGETSPYDEQKVRKSLMAACQDANIAEDHTEGVVEKVMHSLAEELAEKEHVRTSEIRDRALELLEAEEPAAAVSWRAYEESKKQA